MPSLEQPPNESRLDPGASALTRTAHRLAARPHHCIALVPATPGMRLHPVAVALGLELSALEHRDVAIVTTAESVLAGALVDAARGVIGRWVGPETVVLAPAVGLSKMDATHAMGSVLEYAKQRYGRIVVDVSPISSRSGQFALTRWADGVCIVARKRVTKELELLRLQGDILEDRNLGVLLIEE